MTTIKVDWDSKILNEKSLYSLAFISDYYSITKMIIKKSTHKNYHLILEIREDIDDKELLLIQIFLGSDIKREMLNFKRWLNGGKMKDWNILFNNKINKKIEFNLK